MTDTRFLRLEAAHEQLAAQVTELHAALSVTLDSVEKLVRQMERIRARLAALEARLPLLAGETE